MGFLVFEESLVVFVARSNEDDGSDCLPGKLIGDDVVGVDDFV